MKTKEELNALKNEVETLNKKLAELSEEELEQVTGGSIPNIPGLGFGIEVRDGRLMQDNPNFSGKVYARIVRTDGDRHEVSPWYTLSELAEILPTVAGKYKIDYIVMPD